VNQINDRLIVRYFRKSASNVLSILEDNQKKLRESISVMNQLHIAMDEMINLQNKQMTVIRLVMEAVIASSETQDKILHAVENLNDKLNGCTTLFPQGV
jgi:hypothetical protein